MMVPGSEKCTPLDRASAELGAGLAVPAPVGSWARVWQLRTRTLDLVPRPLVMGIVNVTPDSFSDGGRFFDSCAAVEHALRLVEEGADLLDIGGESTRPYAAVVPAAEELRRVLPVIEALQGRVSVPISIDTSKPEVALEAVSAGAEIINDVTGFRDPRMVQLAVSTQVGVCAMHMQGTPQTMQDAPQYQQVVADVKNYLQETRDHLLQAGIVRERICLDPGIGFGKLHAHNFELLQSLARFHELGQPLLVGHSRKGFIAKWIGNSEADRTAATLGCSLGLACHGVQILRVHDVLATRQGWTAFSGTWPAAYVGAQGNPTSSGTVGG